MMQDMKPYSEDLRRSIVRAVEGGTSKPAAARLFGVSLSSVKRYLRIAERGRRWRRGRGAEGRRRPTRAQRETPQGGRRQGASGRHRLRKASIPRERVTGKTLSDSTVKRLLKRLAFSRKNGLWGATERDEWLRAA